MTSMRRSFGFMLTRPRRGARGRVWSPAPGRKNPGGAIPWVMVPLLELADRSELTAGDLVVGHIGQRRVAVGIERPGAQHAAEVLGVEDGVTQSLALGGVAARRAHRFDVLD